MATTDEAIAFFDSQPPAKPDHMIGQWVGGAYPTAHPMDGMLSASYWSGKIFEDTETVHPLVHDVPIWGEVCINPGLLPIRLVTALPMRNAILPVLFPVLAPLLRTRKPRARLREVTFRGRTHAAMVYDDKPIIDVFVQTSADELLGWMDFRGMDKPFFFTLRRTASGD